MQSSEVAELSDRIRASVETGDTVATTLSTSQRIIARVTDGIYREPWAAFRELVANAYDADAKRVVIETGAPDFVQVVVRDDGNGMSAETLAYVVKNIGGSSKRTSTGVALRTSSALSSELSPGGRPLIGKIGIGLFAVAQLTQHFQIITKAAGESVRTSATIKLRTHEEGRSDVDDNEEPYVAGEVSFTAEKVPDSELESHGTAVVLYSLRPEITRSLQSYGRWASTVDLGDDGRPVREPPIYHIGRSAGTIDGNDEGVAPNLPWTDNDGPKAKFDAFFEAAGAGSGRGNKSASLEHFDEYLRLIWQLSLSLPLPYVRSHPFAKTGQSGVIFFGLGNRERQAQLLEVPEKQTLREYLSISSDDPVGGFAVTLDDVQLFRPIELPNTLRKDSRLTAPVMLAAKVGPVYKKSDLERAGGQLKFEAYLYWNSKIVPKDTSGVLIRVRNASGTLFDPDFLRYQISEQNRLGQITSEIFVTEGLDAAINIDRESFNYSHPHYIYIQKWLHRALRLLVNRVKSIAEADLRREKEAQKAEAEKGVMAAALSVWKSKRGETSDPPLGPAVSFDSTTKEVGGTEVEIPEASSDARAVALAVVLESYGVLSGLSYDDRSRLIVDILRVLEIQQ